jgi:3-hydroxyisobutyrate dehydrogenase-like beta-hydroxyacid dehydrogenase
MDNATSQPVGVIGTGLFATALADRLMASGSRVVVYNRTREKADPLVARGAVWSDNPLRDCQRVVFSVYTTDQVLAVLQQMQAGLRPGQIILDTSTSDPRSTAALGTRLAQQGVAYLESPFSGSSEQTRNHQSTAIVAGDQAVFDKCQDLWACLAAKTFYVGAWGNAAKMKLVTNLVLGLNRVALAEGLALAAAAGLTKQDTLEVLLNSPAYSRMMDSKGAKMVHGDFTPQAKLSQHIKDVRLMLAEADRGGITLPITMAHLDVLEQAEAAGFGEQDNSAIIQAIENPKRQRCQTDEK